MVLHCTMSRIRAVLRLASQCWLPFSIRELTVVAFDANTVAGSHPKTAVDRL
jgi:hypothetical protein